MKKLKSIILEFIYELHWGQFIVGKLQFIVTLLVLVKVYNWSIWLNAIIVIGGILFTWLSGKLWSKYFKEDFQYKMFKGALRDNKELKK